MEHKLKKQSAANDEVHRRLKALVEQPTTRCLWTEADAITFVPPLSSTIYGDGRALFALTTLNNRPAYWIIRGDSSWTTSDASAPDGAPDFGDFSDEIIDDLMAEFGSARCGYSGANLYQSRDHRQCDCEECQDDECAEWPMVDHDGGCSWGRMDWPKEFATTPHPWLRYHAILDDQPGPKPDATTETLAAPKKPKP